MDRVSEIKRLYLNATRATIRRDLDRAIELLKAMDTDEERERAAVFMDGLSQMRSEWGIPTENEKRRTENEKRKTEKTK